MNTASGLYHMRGDCVPHPFLSRQHYSSTEETAIAGRPILEEETKKRDNFFLKLLDSLRIDTSVIVFSSHFCFLVLRDSRMQ